MRSLAHPSRLSALLAAGAVAMALAPGTAGAASVAETAGSLSFSGATGEANAVKIEPWGLAIRVTDTGTKGSGQAVALAVGTGCWKLSANSAACAVPTNGIQFQANDGDDSLDASTLTRTSVSAGGGAGNDTLLTGGGADSLSGGDGVDTLSGGAGDDSFQTRDDSADRIVCGAGSDSGTADAYDTIAADCESVLPPAGSVDPNPDPGSTDPDPVDPEDPATDPDDPT